MGLVMAGMAFVFGCATMFLAYYFVVWDEREQTERKIMKLSDFDSATGGDGIIPEPKQDQKEKEKTELLNEIKGLFNTSAEKTSQPPTEK